jgi:hypothetical protein
MKHLTEIVRSLPLALFVLIFLQPGLYGSGGRTHQSFQNDPGALIDVTASEFEGIAGSVRFDFPDIEELDTPLGTFTVLHLSNTTPVSEIGKPELPVLRRFFHIPSGADPELLLQSIDERLISMATIGITRPILPVQPPIPKTMDPLDQREFVIDESLYGADRFFPYNIADIVETGVIRGHSYAIVEFYPVRYNPAREEFSLLVSAEFELHFEGEDPVVTRKELERTASLPFEKILTQGFVNHDAYHPVGKTMLPPPLGLLIIVPDAYYADALSYSEWKIQKGFYTNVATLSETGSNRNDIYDYIQDAYLTWDVPPTYVLLFGDTNLIPCYQGSVGSHETDLKYVSVVGGDWLPDMSIGRFPFRTSSQLNTMIKKNLDYETLNLPSTDFMNNACFIASDDPWFWDLAEDTHRYVISRYMRPNGIHSTIIRGHSGGNTQDISNAVNAGQTFVNYSGHGWTGGWGGPNFSQTNVRNLTNQDMYPFVISHACDTGSYEQSECYAETWVRESNKGGLAFWGASNSTYWDEDDFLERRMYDANFLRSFTTIGEQTYAGLYWMNIAGWGMAHYYFEAYNIMGDPSVDLYMGVPFDGDISYPSSIYSGPQEFIVEALDGGEGVKNALVCLIKDAEVYETGYTGSDGTVTLTIDPLSPGTMGVTVTAHNMVPHEGTVAVESMGTLKTVVK